MKICMWKTDSDLTPGRWAIANWSIATDNVDQAGVTILAYATNERFARIIIQSLNDHDSAWWGNQLKQFA